MKRDVALAWLERSSVFVHLDPRRASVAVPPWFRKQPELVLQIGLNMPVPIKDLRLDEDALSCTLSFNRSPFFCVVPWASLFAIRDESRRVVVWFEDVPVEVSWPTQGRAQEVTGRKSQSVPKLAVAQALADGGVADKARRPRRRTELEAVAEAEGRPGDGRAGEGRVQVPQAPASQPGSSPLGVAPRRRELPPYLRIVK